MHHMERHLARHALGLPTLAGEAPRPVTYRNRYHTTLASEFGSIWQGMVAKGWAELVEITGKTRMGHFRLTRTGAELALGPDESLCPEDFPAEVVG